MAKKYDDVYDFIIEYIDLNDIPPTRQEIMDGTKYKSKSPIANALSSLEKQGRIILVPSIARGIRIPKAKKDF